MLCAHELRIPCWRHCQPILRDRQIIPILKLTKGMPQLWLQALHAQPCRSAVLGATSWFSHASAVRTNPVHGNYPPGWAVNRTIIIITKMIIEDVPTSLLGEQYLDPGYFTQLKHYPPGGVCLQTAPAAWCPFTVDELRNLSAERNLEETIVKLR